MMHEPNLNFHVYRWMVDGPQADVADYWEEGCLPRFYAYVKDNYQLDITVADAKRIHNDFTRRYPEIQEYMEHWKSQRETV
jgi:hypothetical protein